MKSVAVGDNCIDYYNNIDQKFPGGNALNFSVYMSELGNYSSYLGVIGDDKNGLFMKEKMLGKEIDISHLYVKKGDTAVTNIDIKDGERIFQSYNPGVLDDFKLEKKDINFINKHDLIHSSLAGKVSNYFWLFKKRGLITSFDFSDEIFYNNNINSNNTLNILPYLDYAFFSYPHAKTRAANDIKEIYYSHQNSGIIVFTLGSRGSLAFNGNQLFWKNSVAKNVIDTLGAGDSFIAGFLDQVVKGKNIQACLNYGTELALKTIQHNGAW